MARAGVGLAVLYVLVALATEQLSSRPVLPLFDGFAPPTPYSWVNPPPERDGDNVTPRAAEREFPLGSEGSPASNVATDDAQAIVGLDAGSVAPHPPDTAVRVTVTPVDAGTLAPLPPGLRAVSNAYQVGMTYVPSQTPITGLAVKGTVALTAAETGDRLLYSPDGQSWQEREFRPYGQDHGLFTELEAPGWFVVASSRLQAATGGGGPDLLRAVLLVLVAVAPIVGAVLVVTLPSPVPAAPAPRPSRSAPSRARAKAKKRSKRRR
ncbi:MAG: hypothetical protein M3203_14125 [Actinomycetota bacterium]|nr:hypothetical protein [Actinomycetota bacterium]